MRALVTDTRSARYQPAESRFARLSAEGRGWPLSVEVFRADLRASSQLVYTFEGVDATPPGGRGLRQRGPAIRGDGGRHRAPVGGHG
jgi:hypothetical protein